MLQQETRFSVRVVVDKASKQASKAQLLLQVKPSPNPPNHLNEPQQTLPTPSKFQVHFVYCSGSEHSAPPPRGGTCSNYVLLPPPEKGGGHVF